MYWSLFFIVFIILSNFLMMNLFSGVVVSTFNREKEIIHKNNLLSENQKNWIEQKKALLKAVPKKSDYNHTHGFRYKLELVLLSKGFDLTMISLIILNTVTLSINWYA